MTATLQAQKEIMKETISYTVNYMVSKMQEQGYNETQITNYMGSADGAQAVKRLASQFWNSLK